MPTLNFDQVLSYDEDNYTLRLGDVRNDAGLAYLVQYGFSQSLQDSVAGLAKAVRESLGDPADTLKDKALDKFLAKRTANRIKWTNECNIPQDSDIESIVDALLDRRLVGRRDAIMRGELVASKGRGPKRTGMEAAIWNAATAYAESQAKAKNIAMPKKAEARDSMIQAMIDSPKWHDKIIAKAEKAMADQAELDRETAEDAAAVVDELTGTEPAATNGATDPTPPAAAPLPEAPARGKGKGARA